MKHDGKNEEHPGTAPLRPIRIPDRYNYIAVFLTLDCTLSCSYCINRFNGGLARKLPQLPGREWAAGLNRILSRSDLPVTLQGGEPTLYPDFYEIVSSLRPDLNVDLLTNLEFDIEEFIARVDPRRLRREAPYASIRVSYHPEMMHLDVLLAKVLRLQNAGFSIGIWGVLHPDQADEIIRAQRRAAAMGLDFRVKEFLGEHDGKMYGNYKYRGACDKRQPRSVMCRTTELLIGPSGGVYRCHSDLYEDREPIGSILDPVFEIEDVYRPCAVFGQCNPCDVKIKTNRFQQQGHTSVEIAFRSEGDRP